MLVARRALPILVIVIAASLAGCGDGSADLGTPGTGPTTHPATPTEVVDRPPVEPFRDDFADPSSLDDWELTQGNQPSAGPAEVSVENGELRVVSAHASWLDEAAAFGLARSVTGDVDVTARVRTTGRTSDRPDIDWSLAGLMLRDPADGSADWIHWTVGEVDGPVLERKRTSTGHSILDLIELPDAAAVDLRMIRSGDVVVLAYRQREEPWTVAYDYRWAEMPETVDLLLTAQSGGEGDHADLVAYTDWVDVVPATFDQAAMDLLAARDAAPLNG